MIGWEPSIIAWNEKNVSDVILFGSVARGEPTVERDVDSLFWLKTLRAGLLEGDYTT